MINILKTRISNKEYYISVEPFDIYLVEDIALTNNGFITNIVLSQGQSLQVQESRETILNKIKGEEK